MFISTFWLRAFFLSVFLTLNCVQKTIGCEIPAMQVDALRDLQGQLCGSETLCDFNNSTTVCTCPGVQCDEECQIVSVDLKCHFGGQIPSSVGALSPLTRLFLRNNSIEGTVPENFNNLSNLTDLDLSLNKLTGLVPTMAHFKSLENVDMHGNSFEGTVPDIGRFENLTSVDFSYNKLTGVIPDTLMTGFVQQLRLNNNNLTGPISMIPIISSVIDLSHNHLDGYLPERMTYSSSLIYLNFSRNSFEGPLPIIYTGIQFLDLSSNLLRGELSGLVTLHSLIHLNISHNFFTGKIPPLNCSTITHLDLSSNTLTGVVPSSFNNLLNLVMLNVSNNKLTGPLPEMPDNKFQSVDIQGNMFCGVLPSSICSSSVKRIGDKHNFLCGCGNCTEVEPKISLQGMTHSSIPLMLAHFNFTNYTCEGMEVYCNVEKFGQILAKSHPRGDWQYACAIPFSAGMKFDLQLSSNSRVIHILREITMPDCDASSVVCDEKLECYCSCPLLFNRNKMNCRGANILAWSLISTFLVLSVLALVAVVYFVRAQRRKKKNSPELDELSPLNSIPLITDFSDKMDKRVVDALTDKFKPFHWIIPKDQITIGEKIGSGSYAVVFQGVLRNSTAVAVKKFHNFDLTDQNAAALQEIMDEISTWEMLKHPNVVMFFGACFDESDLCIVSEYMEKKSLNHVLAKHNLSWNERVALVTHVASGLCYLHRRDPPVIHRDVKPANILIDKNFIAKLADFGMSRTYDILQRQQTFKGTLFWMAPEIMQGEKYGLESDVFSFGLVMWNILTGKEIPFSPNVNPYKVTQGLRPVIPSLQELVSMYQTAGASDNDNNSLAQPITSYISLMQACWAQVPSDRPQMVDVLKQLQTL